MVCPYILEYYDSWEESDEFFMRVEDCKGNQKAFSSRLYAFYRLLGVFPSKKMLDIVQELEKSKLCEIHRIHLEDNQY